MMKFDHQKAFSQKVQRLLKEAKIDPDHVSMQLLNDEQVLFEQNAKVAKVPASITKNFTAYAVLKTLKPSHRFYTKLYWDGRHLYLKGGGDPSFVSENMWYLVNEFTRTGIKQIPGDIIVDDSLFDTIRYDESRESTRVDRAYDAPVGAMSFNWNSVNVFVKPTRANEKARVIVDPQSGYFDLVNNTKTVSANPKRELAVQISQDQRLITVSGEVSEDAPEKAIYKNVETPDIWSGVNLKFFLEQRGISVSGKIKNGLVPEKAELVGVYESKNLSYILADMNKFSNNYVAEMLTKNLVAAENKTGASLSGGVEKIRELLAEIGLSKKEVKIVNPSGLTRDNSFSAHAMNVVLKEIKNDFSIFSTFNESLPIAGIDGTLKRRFKNTQGEGWIRAKTGYLTNVVTLSGYAGRSDGRVLTFSFLYNGPRDEAKVREVFDQVLLMSLK